MSRMCILLFFVFFGLLPLHAVPGAEAAFVGLTLEELINRFGVPRSVHAVRGLEEWQDDVVFVYEEGDFYIFRDRVWQVGLRTFMGINSGDPGSIVSLILDSVPGFSRLRSPENSVSYYMYDGSWPMILRCDFDDRGRIRGIFIFRSDL